jgi:hypothetical protein
MQLPKYKVFVFGLDITKDVTNIAIEWGANKRSPAVCSITLISPYNKYIVTVDDLIDAKLIDPKVANTTKLIDPTGNQFEFSNEINKKSIEE